MLKIINGNKHILCIDNGLSGGKAALVDIDGNISSVLTFKNKIINEGIYSEIDVGLFYQNTVDAVKELITKSSVSPYSIVAGTWGINSVIKNCLGKSQYLRSLKIIVLVFSVTAGFKI